jgi:hypothetical protein
MAKKLVSITFWVTMSGTIWQGIEATKDKQLEFVSEKHNAYTPKWNGLWDALTKIVNDGDFQYCNILWGCMVVRWFDGKYFLELERNIPRCKLTEQFLAEDYDN